MKWQPISESEIMNEINSSCERMSPDQKQFWEAIKNTPNKWREKKYGKEVESFWVVAIIGNTIVWYNDIEEEFNHSKYHNYGEIDDDWCYQNELEWVIQNIIDEIKRGYDPAINSIPLF